jgi:hypothetical protein
MSNTTTSEGAVVKTRRRRTAEERRKELAERLAKLDNRESNRAARRVCKVLSDLEVVSAMTGTSDNLRSAIGDCKGLLQPFTQGNKA